MVLWYNESMLFSAENFYRLTTATSIANSGTGVNPLTKPAGVKVASIAPNKKHSVFIPSAATFTTDFSLDSKGFTIMFYAKPEPGVVLEVEGNTVVFTGHSYQMSNDTGEGVEIAVRSNSARLIAWSYSDMEMSLFVDGASSTITARNTSNSGQVNVSLLQSGGILDNVVAVHGQLTTEELAREARLYSETPDLAPDVIVMNDNIREFVVSREVSAVESLNPGEVKEIKLRGNDPNGFKIEYLSFGDVNVVVNGVDWESGMGLEETPDSMVIFSGAGGRLEDIVITEYYSDALGTTSSATFETDMSSGSPSPTYRHDDAAANIGDTVVTVDETANTVSGWFYATDGSPLPGVTMTDGILTGTNLFVNGEPYSGGQVLDWYFLTRVAPVSGTFTVDVPTHAMHVTPNTLSNNEIDDLYESFFGNPTFTAAQEEQLFTELPAFIISTEWNIVASG